MKRELILLLILLALFVFATDAHAQRVRGELHIEVRDLQGAALGASAELVSDGNQFRRSFQVAADGLYVAQGLPFGMLCKIPRSRGIGRWPTKPAHFAFRHLLYYFALECCYFELPAPRSYSDVAEQASGQRGCFRVYTAFVTSR